MIEEMPNGVRINTTFIPAMNLQIEGYPRWSDRYNGTEAWYPLYFEVMFETGDLWVVCQGDHPEEPDKIMLEVHKRWANSPDVDPSLIMYLDNWTHFITIYKKTLEHGLEAVA